MDVSGCDRSDVGAMTDSRGCRGIFETWLSDSKMHSMPCRALHRSLRGWPANRRLVAQTSTLVDLLDLRAVAGGLVGVAWWRCPGGGGLQAAVPTHPPTHPPHQHQLALLLPLFLYIYDWRIHFVSLPQQLADAGLPVAAHRHPHLRRRLASSRCPLPRRVAGAWARPEAVPCSAGRAGGCGCGWRRLSSAFSSPHPPVAGRVCTSSTGG